MPDSTPTWRKADDDIVHGRQRLIFVRDGSWQLTALAYFADGQVTWQYGPPSDLAGLRQALADGTLALAPPDGTVVHVPGAGRFTMTADGAPWTAPMVLGDIADEVDGLNQRPDSSRRAYDAFRAYADDPSEERLETARSAYLAVPRHRRIYMLGDMDHNDVPARILLAGIGEEIPARRPGTTLTVTAEAKDGALDYFLRITPAVSAWERRHTADGPDTPTAAAVVIGGHVHPQGWPDPPGLDVLQNDYPASVVHRGREYRTVTHAYWALSTGDPAWHDRIADADRGFDAVEVAFAAPRRDGWAAARLAVMGTLLRDKCRRHPLIAATLLSTGDARVLYSDTGSCYWTRDGREGSNWMGRLLEVVRSELAAGRGGILS
ncbi:NADAR family protein [Actinoplanes sp. NEAU-A12]|uniref:NADAR family protein n=1 Tax=Actinoplanes sandaracinus TaxID=3045177 RepID=A0ABT6X0K3_9ACTN|nr:NADAR family protein [Actinoplanes sandaracinus]MDI6105513.1 NADAR family protein [Actinoplanes sandaracinus]